MGIHTDAFGAPKFRLNSWKIGPNWWVYYVQCYVCTVYYRVCIKIYIQECFIELISWLAPIGKWFSEGVVWSLNLNIEITLGNQIYVKNSLPLIPLFWNISVYLFINTVCFKQEITFVFESWDCRCTLVCAGVNLLHGCCQDFLG